MLRPDTLCLRGYAAHVTVAVRRENTYIGCMVANGWRNQELVNVSPLLLGRYLMDIRFNQQQRMSPLCHTVEFFHLNHYTVSPLYLMFPTCHVASFPDDTRCLSPLHRTRV